MDGLVCFSGNIDYDQRKIVFLYPAGFPSRPRCKVVEQRIRKAVRRQVAVFLDECLESFLSEQVSRKVCRFDDSIGVHEDPIAGDEPDRDTRVCLMGAESQWQAVLLELENFPL